MRGGALGSCHWSCWQGVRGPEEGHGPSARLGAAPWSLAPKAGALGLALLCLLLGALLSEGRPPCREEEFPVGAMCCPRCSPGHRVKEACGETTGTVCAPCSPGTYTAHLNGLDACLPCRVCDPDTGLLTRRKCSSTGNTVCGCDRGHFCVLVDGDDCAECRNHSDCRPGQRVQETGTEWQDTVCEDCPPGTFSAGGTQAVCEPWTNCRTWSQTDPRSPQSPPHWAQAAAFPSVSPAVQRGRWRVPVSIRPPGSPCLRPRSPPLLSLSCSSPCEMETQSGTNSTDVTSSSSKKPTKGHTVISGEDSRQIGTQQLTKPCRCLRSCQMSPWRPWRRQHPCSLIVTPS